MKILIIETGIAPDPLAAKHGTYFDMFCNSLQALDENIYYVGAAIFNGEPMPDISEVDGILITGSPAGVYDDLPWIAPLENLIREALSTKKPVVGICFGHQIMTQALGGRVEKSGKGWGAGVHTYNVTGTGGFAALEAQEQIICAVSHQDQVITPPEGAERLAGSAFCPYGLLQYAQGPALSMQMHPEFTADFGSALLQARLDRIPSDVSDLGLFTYSKGEAGSKRQILLNLIVEFFQKHAG